MRVSRKVEGCRWTIGVLALALSGCVGDAAPQPAPSGVDGDVGTQTALRENLSTKESPVVDLVASGSPATGQVVSVDAEAVRLEVLERAMEAQQEPGQLPSSRPSTPINSELNQALLKQLDEAERQIEAARAQLGDSSQNQVLDISTQLLATVRARLADVGPTTETALAGMDQQISVAMDSAQAEIDLLRATIPGSPNAAALMAQLDQSQRQLDVARAHTRAVATAATPMTEGELSELIAKGRRSLDEARVRAAALPDGAKMLDQIDAAQRQLDQAALAYRTGSPASSVPPTK